MKNIMPNISMHYKNDSVDKNKYIGQHDLEKKLNERIIQLEEELQYTKECLQTSNEEHLVYNEELQSINEEYQAVNDELLKINTQYQYKNQELADLYDDMTNYLDSADIGTIFLDENLCIRKFTPSITKEINLKEQDIGRPMNHISNNLINDDLNMGASEVLNSHMSYEKEIQSKNGRWYLLKCEPYCTVENLIKGVVLSLVDITRSKHAEIEMVRSKERYEQLVENSPYSIYIIQNGKFYFSNSAGIKLLKAKDLNELMFIQYAYYFNIDEEELIDNGVNSIQMHEKTIIPKEDRIILPDGTVLLVEISAMPLLFDGSAAKLLLVRDTSFRIKERLLEEENKKNKRLLDETILSETLKTEFFSNLSHELRTPLNVILSALQLLDTYASGSDVNDKEIKFKKYSNIMKQNCYRQLRLVNNMIDITKLDAGFFELTLQNCNIINIVESVTMSVAEYIKSKSIELIFDTDIEECIIPCDPEKIERVILNLLANSIKFTKPGGNITVNMYDKGENIIISIKDTGIGIPNDKLDIIFDRFRQVDRSLTRNQEGSGIGLSIVKSLVELHGGKISVLSEYGKGTEFIIVFPVIVLPEENDICEVFEAESQERIERIHIEFSDIYSLN
ncbi:PAS domain-containing protein [Clostridium algoriphilum]|uniref:sensor histidine kinase n=1 Tax=Clostridium algoriphilum TaxID=198347 RepID=UPI001CF147E5|nr:ATP-binding protein [Clostridium algoriphilum]MCB2294243.1 PAS domain-containing protein [Clostridium algoriphilum]